NRVDGDKCLSQKQDQLRPTSEPRSDLRSRLNQRCAPLRSLCDCVRITGDPECAGINRHVVGDARAGKPWKNWRRSRSRIRCWPGIESSSPTSSKDRDFANESVARESTDPSYGVLRFKLGSIKGSKKSGFSPYATPPKRLRIFEFLVRDQEVGGSNPLALRPLL